MARVGDGDAPETRVGEKVLAPGHAEERLPVRVGVGNDREIAVLGGKRPPPAVQHPLVAGAIQRGKERLAVEVLHHHPRHHRLEHRDLDGLPLPRARLVVEPGQERVCHRHRARLVGHNGREIAWVTDERRLQRGEA